MHRHQYAGPFEKRVDFWTGFGGWIAFNAIAVFGLTFVGPHPTRGFVLSAVLVLINLGAPIVAAFTRGYIALGIVCVFATALALAVVEGVFFTVSDFVSHPGSTLTTINYGFLIAGLIVLAIGAGFVLRKIHQGIR